MIIENYALCITYTVIIILIYGVQWLLWQLKPFSLFFTLYLCFTDKQQMYSRVLLPYFLFLSSFIKRGGEGRVVADQYGK
jgi:hypothetical protein